MADPNTELVRTASLNAYHLNPRKGNVPLIQESLREHGQYKPLIVNRGSLTGRPNEVLAGNHLLQAGMAEGLTEMLVHWLDVDDEKAARIVLVDNRASDKGGYDQSALAELLGSLDDLAGTGYAAGDLTRLLNGLEEGDQGGLTDPDDVPSLPAREPVTKPGDVWLLGKHRLVCGDSTRMETMAAVADGEEIDAMWTDPPYGVLYVGKTSEALSIQNDGKEGLAELLHSAFLSALTVLRPGSPVYVAHADTERVTFENALRDAGYIVRQNLIWVKNTLVLGRSDYQYKHEPILEVEAPPEVDLEGEPEEDPVTHEPVLYGFTEPGKKQGRLGRGGEKWFGNNKQTTVFEVPKPAANREHPTMKPVDLIVMQLRNSVVRGGRVLDLFAGSGSTLLAAHRLDMIAHLVELDPRYCDVICARYERHTGVRPVLERTGTAVSFAEKE